jgi:hypothetical protein
VYRRTPHGESVSKPAKDSRKAPYPDPSSQDRQRKEIKNWPHLSLSLSQIFVLIQEEGQGEGFAMSSHLLTAA